MDSKARTRAKESSHLTSGIAKGGEQNVMSFKETTWGLVPLCAFYTDPRDTSFVVFNSLRSYKRVAC